MAKCGKCLKETEKLIDGGEFGFEPVCVDCIRELEDQFGGGQDDYQD